MKESKQLVVVQGVIAGFSKYERKHTIQVSKRAMLKKRVLSNRA
jgi:hypothetical protein